MDSDSPLLYVEVPNPVTLGCGGVKRTNEASEHLPEERRPPHSLAGGVSCISHSLGPAFGSLLLLAGPFGGWGH